MTPRFYAVTPAAALGESRVMEAAAVAPDPAPGFGEVRGPTPGVLARAQAVRRYVFRDAVVHGPEGAVTVGRRVVAESLGQVPPSWAWQGGGLWMTRHHDRRSALPEAEHLLCAVPGNYFHWLLDGVARRAVLPGGHAAPLLPWTRAAFQQGAVAGAVHVGVGESVQVGRLGWSTSLTSNGGAYHPALSRLRGSAPPGPDIYVARSDAANRPLRNEAAVMEACRARGFQPVLLSGMTLAAQAALFAGARRIVAPHGAGLANLVFCCPGAAVLELMMDQYANFCFRRLAACAGLRWGAVVGRSEPGDPRWVHGTGWSLDLDRLARALDDPGFRPEDPT